MSEQAVTLPAKRKRAQINYADEDEELDALIFDRESGHDDSSSASFKSDGDDPQFRLDGKVLKKKIPTKRTKLVKEKKVEPFRFTSLPAELRHQIYKIALSDEEVTLVYKSKSYRHTVVRRPIPEHERRRGRGFGGYYGYGYGHMRDEPPRFRGKGRERASQVEAQDEAQSEVESEVEEGVQGDLQDEAHQAVAKSPDAGPNKFYPNLLAVSRQIKDEASGFLYGQPFVFEDTKALHTFLASIGPANCLLLKDITLVSWSQGRGTHKTMDFCGLTSLSACTNLNVLYLNCSVTSWHRNDPEGLAQLLFRDGHHFFEAYGSAHKKRDAAVDMLELNDWNFAPEATRKNPTPDPEVYRTKFKKELSRLLLFR